MLHKFSKNYRILAMFQQLYSGKIVIKSECAHLFKVDERSIQRDIDDIRAYLSEKAANEGSDGLQVVYNREHKGFILQGCTSPLMNNSEILSVCKILLSSRAFTKEEMSSILDKLISGCVPLDNMKIVSDLLANEKFHYTELRKPSGLQDKIWALGQAVHKHDLIQIQYCRQGEEQKPVVRIVEPVSIVFSEYYFYLNAYIDHKKNGQYIHSFDYPAIFRVDRIYGLDFIGQQFSLPYADRFQEGEFLKRVQFMYPGALMTIRFRYNGTSIEAVLDRLPTAEIVKHDALGYVVKAEVYGKGILMWLLSQGDKVEVLSPASLRAEMKTMLEAMLKNYLS